MASLKEVRIRIKSVSSTQQITKAMKMVAAAKLRRAQDGILRMRPYAQKLSDILTNLNTDAESAEIKKYATSREIKNVLIVVITSDRGLCGAFNTNVIKGTTALIKEKYSKQASTGNVTLLTIGKKCNEYFAKRDFPIISTYTGLFLSLSFDEVKPAAEEAINGFLSSKYDVVEIIYNEFKNVATQVVKVEQFLPLVSRPTLTKKSNTDYIYEPNKSDILSDLVPKSLKIQFYKGVLESNASEHGARMTAMDKATENAGEMLKALKLSYNRTRQAAITKEILEIVGGAEALNN